ncbi:SDR family oxidoreductase [Kineococcus sp. NUM-3379]
MVSDRVAVVTGAGSGIGRATAQRLLRAGARVALLGRSGPTAEDAAAQARADGRALWQVADVSDAYQLVEARDVVHERFGPVDLVVANAGVMSGAPFEDAVPGEWAEMIDVNLRGVLHTAQTFARDLLGAADAGRCSDLVVIGAIAGTVRYPQYAVYSAIEAAVAQLARTLRAEYGGRGVRVRNIQPGLTRTGLGGAMSDAPTRRQWEDLRRSVPPLDADHVARTVLFTVTRPAHVNIADLVVLPTRQDGHLPIRVAGPR